MMTLDIATYDHKATAPVEAVRVTEENLEAVAEWCGGTSTIAKANKRHSPSPCVDVPVPDPRPTTPKRAFVGNWVLKTDRGWKVYTDSAFVSNFERVASYTEAAESFVKKADFNVLVAREILPGVVSTQVESAHIDGGNPEGLTEAELEELVEATADRKSEGV